MSNITIYIANSFKARTEMAFVSGARAKELAMKFFREGDYNRYKTIVVLQEGESAAEEAFDLTNNPSRQEEREEKYGRGPSVSSGDIVDVDGTLYLCCSFGWEKLSV